MLFGEGGALTGKSCPRIVVDCSTIAPSEARDLAERAAKKGVVFLDAPVTGGDLGEKAAHSGDYGRRRALHLMSFVRSAPQSPEERSVYGCLWCGSAY